MSDSISNDITRAVSESETASEDINLEKCTESENKVTCDICFEEYTTELPPIEIKNCKHYFHKKCLTKWTQDCGEKGKDPSCPNCRQKYKEVDLKVN